MSILIERALKNDFEILYSIGKNTPELKVSDEDFMSPQEFAGCLENPKGLLLKASHDARPVGFLYAQAEDPDARHSQVACLVYVAVLPEYRNRGIATKMCDEAERLLRERGVSSIYGWVNMKSEPTQRFLERRGMKKGFEFVWMDKKL